MILVANKNVRRFSFKKHFYVFAQQGKSEMEERLTLLSNDEN